MAHVLQDRAVVLHRYGDADQLQLEPVSIPSPGHGQARIRHTAIGVNYHDIYVRSGAYRTLGLPGVPGIDAAGVVESVGQGVSGVAEGDRVFYISASYGAYATRRVIDADQLLILPASVDDKVAAATMLRGMTAIMLLDKHHPVRAGEICLVHAASGGVGRILCQLARHRGCIVIGVVRSEEKRAAASSHGCQHVVVLGQDDFVDCVRSFTGGEGVDVVFDSIGRDTFSISLEALAIGGRFVSAGQSSGPVNAIPPSVLARKSNSLWRPILFHYLTKAVDRVEMLNQVAHFLDAGVITSDIGAVLPLERVADAHRLLERGQRRGSVVLVPEEVP